MPPRRAGRFPRSLRSLGMTNYNCVRGVFIWIDIIQPIVHPYRPLSLRAKRGNLPETKCRPHIRASQLTYTVKVLSLRGAQRATWQSPGREDGRSVHEQIPFSRGISPLRSDYRPHSGRNDIIKQADKKPSPEGEGLTGHIHDVISSVRDGL